MPTEHVHGAAIPAQAPPAEPAPDLEGWAGLEDTPEFKNLVRARWRFVLPATVFFLVYYFLLPVLNGVATDFMRTKVIGDVNVAYLFALSEFFMAWILAWFYIRRANRVFDPLAEKVRERARSLTGRPPQP
ncbi:MAG TPA: DUF485 domain-containing protein [Candidatus Dormibacteraeota bacterium]|jgi:uncharacterized membrane protein (DUF485 family)